MKKWLLEGLAIGLMAGLGAVVAFSQTSTGTKSNTAPSMSQSGATQQSSATDRDQPLSAADKSFIQKAAQGGMAEVEFGKLAQQQASNSSVKDFAKRMVNDHGKANEQLRSIATKAGVAWPSDLSSAAKAIKDKLSKLQGAAFDKAYMNEMLKDHRADSTEFQKTADTTKNAEIKDFASSTLTIVKDHLQLAEETAPKVGITVTKTTAKLQ